MTSSGAVRGHAARNRTEVSEYLGIPYAQPPMGQLRFAAPRMYILREPSLHLHMYFLLNLCWLLIKVGLTFRLVSVCRFVTKVNPKALTTLHSDCPQLGESAPPLKYPGQTPQFGPA